MIPRHRSCAMSPGVQMPTHRGLWLIPISILSRKWSTSWARSGLSAQCVGRHCVQADDPTIARPAEVNHGNTITGASVQALIYEPRPAAGTSLEPQSGGFGTSSRCRRSGRPATSQFRSAGGCVAARRAHRRAQRHDRDRKGRRSVSTDDAGTQQDRERLPASVGKSSS